MKKIILSIVLGLALVFSAIGFAGCDLFNSKSSGSKATRADAEIMEVYAEAQANGFTGTYDEWVEWIKEQAKGEKGDKGDQGEKGEKGDKGDTGNGILKIEKTGTAGPVDTYTITFTNGATTTFTVTNGKDGEDVTNSKNTFIFYRPDGSVFEEILVNEGTKPCDVNYKNYVDYNDYCYTFNGWYSYDNNDFKNIKEYDISSENYQTGTNATYEYVALMEIKDDGWVYSGQNANAFVWDQGEYASVAINLSAGDNYIKFDKTIGTEKLKLCKVFVNGGSGNYVQSLEILDNNGIKISDIDLSDNVWENLQQEATNTSSYIIKIKTTTAFEAGIMIGSNLG